jgi:hypothetical protein
MVVVRGGAVAAVRAVDADAAVVGLGVCDVIVRVGAAFVAVVRAAVGDGVRAGGAFVAAALVAGALVVAVLVAAAFAGVFFTAALVAGRSFSPIGTTRNGGALDCASAAAPQIAIKLAAPKAINERFTGISP